MLLGVWVPLAGCGKTPKFAAFPGSDTARKAFGAVILWIVAALPGENPAIPHRFEAGNARPSAPPVSCTGSCDLRLSPWQTPPGLHHEVEVPRLLNRDSDPTIVPPLNFAVDR